MQKGGEPSVNQDQVFESLKASKFKQQKLPAWRPVPTITSTTITFVSFGVIFITIGVVVLVYSGKIVDKIIQYDKDCNNVQSCTQTVKIDKLMEKPVMVYYQLNNFYQNHRRYVKSKSDDQLVGKVIDLETMKNNGDCSPVETNEKMGKTIAADGVTALDPAALAIPCGLIAKSLFNDDYTLKGPDGAVIPINQNDIAWQADRDLKFKNQVKDGDENAWKKVQWIDMTNEHFIVWMRPAGLPNFRKLWGRIEQDLQPGDYSFVIQNNFDVTPYSGEKFIVLSTVNAFGGNNSFLGIAYIVVGGVCILLAVIFLIGYQIHQKKKNN